jgi:pilus assembly protein CpaB
MMRNRVGVILVLALLSAVAAAYLAFRFLREPAATTVESRTTSAVSVVVAARDMPLGTVLSTPDVKVVDWPAAALPEGYSASPAEVVGRGILTQVRMNEPLLSTKLALAEAGGGLPIVIPEGKRGLSVQVDNVSGVAGFILPGTRVDVVVTLDQLAQYDEPVAQIVLQNIQVLTAGQTIERTVQGEPITVQEVTLLVTPEEAERLTLASTKGRIRLALRNTLDLAEVETPGVRTTQLITMRSATAQPTQRRFVPRRPAGVSVNVYRGAQRETETVQRSGGSEGGGS